MTREERTELVKHLKYNRSIGADYMITDKDADEIIKALGQEPCDDCISREEALKAVDKRIEQLSKDEVFIRKHGAIDVIGVKNFLLELPSVYPKPKTGHCKECKWWKDNDGTFRRGIGAESQCPINRIEVYEGNGYCFMFEPQKSEG